ncbi:MAG: MFS transporter [Desulfobacteraceae bacterium]|nr:MFS transporter [Desulfobacteraceae bacterium]
MSTSTAFQPKVDYKIIVVLTLVHFTGDFYSSFTAPLLPVFVKNLGLTLTQVGILTGTVRLFSFIIQPLTGYFADRYESRAFVFIGLCLSFFFIPFTGIATNFYTLLILLCMGSIGSSMFHPSTTAMVPLYSGNRTGFCLSIYNTGGTFAFAIGPVFITWYVSRFGLTQMPYTIAVGMIAFLICFKFLPVPVSENLNKLGFVASMKENFGKVYKIIFLIWLVMFLRSVTGQTFMTFMPILLEAQGHSLVSVGLIVAFFVSAGTLSGLLCGYLADRTSFKKIFFIVHLLMCPALLLFLYIPEPFVLIGSFCGGFTVLASMPLALVMAQKLVPKSRAMVSSLIMGFAYGLGGIISPFVGRLADIYGIETILFYTAFVPLLTLVFILKFPDIRHTQ